MNSEIGKPVLKRKDGLYLLRKMMPAFFWIIVWTVAYFSVRQDLLLASPWQVLSQFSMMLRWPFWQMIGSSLGRSLFAYMTGILLGAGLAAGCNLWLLMDELIRPLMRMIRAVPVASFIILALVWLSSEWVPVFTGILMVMPVVFANCREGIASADAKLVEMARMYQWPKTKIWRYIIFPSAVPTLLAACEACIGLCFKAVIAAEVLGEPRAAVGTAIYHAKIYLETDQLMMWTLVVVLMSMGLEWILKKIVGSSKRHGYSSKQRV